MRDKVIPMTLPEALEKILNVPVNDPDDARRRRLLNVMLLGVGIMTLLLLLVTCATDISGMVERDQGIVMVYEGGVITLVGTVIIWAINRYSVGWLASSLFMTLLTVIISLSDDPIHIVEGRGLFLFTIPILMASVTLRPWASFVFAGMSSVVISLLALTIPGYVPPVPAMLGFFTIAFVSWLASRTLEQALAEVRETNRNLDNLVAERTRELQRANEQLAAANERLRELDRLKSLFVSMVSHELRTPLNAILGYADILREEVYGPLSDKQKEMMGRIIASARRQMGLVSDLLDRAQIEAGTLSLHIDKLSPKGLMYEMQETMSVLASSKGLELVCKIDDDVPRLVKGDQKRLYQVLVNLVNNAIKFTEEGRVTVHMFCHDKEHWAMRVSDTGPGIPAELQHRVFEPFWQADGSATRKHGGIGLGLSIAQQLVRLMGGEITLESQVGKGTTFTVILPINPPVNDKGGHNDEHSRGIGD